jgi:hypothetical protein
MGMEQIRFSFTVLADVTAVLLRNENYYVNTATTTLK